MHFINKNLKSLLLILPWTCVGLSQLEAQTWDGGGAAAPWSNASNWVNDVAPAANDSLTFAGTTQLSTSNDYTAGTQFNGITVSAGAGAFVLAGNSINLGGSVSNLSTNTLSISLPLVLLQDTTFNAATNGITATGGISGTGFDLVKTGLGTLTLGTVLNTYTGETKLLQGGLTLSYANTTGSTAVNLISNSSALEMGGGSAGTALAVTSKNSGTNSQTFNGTTIKAGNNVVTVARGNATGSMTLNLGALTRQAGGTLHIAQGTNGTLGSTVHVDATGTVSNGILGGWATYGSDWATLSGGDVVAYSGYSSLSSLGGNQYAIGTGATNNLRIDSTSTVTVASNTFTAASTTINVANASTHYAVGDVISGPGIPPGATVTAIDPGNAFITISSNTNAAGTAANLVVSKPISLTAAGVTDVNTIQVTDSNNRVIDIGSGKTLRLGEYGGIWRNVAGIAASSYGHRLTINNGTLTAGGADNTAGEITFNTGGSNLGGSQSSGSRPNRGMVINSVIADNGTGKVTVIKNGFEALLLAGANTYTGNTYVQRGILESTSANNLGGSGATVYVDALGDSNGGQVILSGAGNYANQFYINGVGSLVTPSTVGYNYGALAFGNTNATASGNITLTGDARIGKVNGVTDPSQGFLISGKISGNYQLSFGSANQVGGAYRLSNTANDWSGNTLLSMASTSGENVDLWLGASNVLPDGTGKGNIVFNRGSTGSNQVRLNLNGNDETVNALVSTDSYTGSANLTTQTGFRRVRNMSATTASTLTVGAGNASGSFFGTIENGGAAALNFRKTGTGTQELSGANTYTGTTEVNGGTLLVSGTMTGTSGVTINTGGNFNYTNAAALNRNVTINTGGRFTHNSSADYAGTLTFTGGRLSGTNWNGGLSGLSIGPGQIIAPGNSPGAASTATQSWLGGGAYEFEINNATGALGTNWDHLTLTSNLDISALTSGNPFVIQLVSLDALNAPGLALNFNSGTDYSWEFASFAALTGTFSADRFTVDTSAFDNSFVGVFTVDQVGNTFVLNYSSIPEPSTYALLGIGGLALWALRRRRKA